MQTKEALKNMSRAHQPADWGECARKTPRLSWTPKPQWVEEVAESRHCPPDPEAQCFQKKLSWVHSSPLGWLWVFLSVQHCQCPVFLWRLSSHSESLVKTWVPSKVWRVHRASPPHKETLNYSRSCRVPKTHSTWQTTKILVAKTASFIASQWPWVRPRLGQLCPGFGT